MTEQERKLKTAFCGFMEFVYILSRKIQKPDIRWRRCPIQFQKFELQQQVTQ